MPSANQEWDLNRLLVAFPGLRPERLGVGSRPAEPASGHGHFAADEDDERPGRQGVDVTLAIAPRDAFGIRLGPWRGALEECDGNLELPLVRGIFKAAVNLVTPPALGCEVAVQDITGVADASERALHVAAYRAFSDASSRCEWELAAPFPDVRPDPNEDLEAAFLHVTAAFGAAGFAVGRPYETLSPDFHEVARAFTIHVSAEKRAGVTHVFLVCPYAWTPQTRGAIDEAWHTISYSVGHDGYRTERHLLSAYRRPEESSGDGARTLMQW